jgi:large subunit ribosomal protein L21
VVVPCARQQPARIDVEFIPRISRRARIREREFTVYAIVRCGGRQEKASVDDVLTVDKLVGEVGSSLMLPAVLVVDDGEVISDPAVLGGYQVTAEIVGAASGPKINMVHYKNKTGYRRRLGHRQKYTQVKITKISAGNASASSRKKG